MLFVFQDGRAVSPLNASESVGFVFECVAVSGCGEEEEGEQKDACRQFLSSHGYGVVMIDVLTRWKLLLFTFLAESSVRLRLLCCRFLFLLRTRLRCRRLLPAGECYGAFRGRLALFPVPAGLFRALPGSLRHGGVCGFLGMGMLPPVVAGVVSLAAPGAAAACAVVR